MPISSHRASHSGSRLGRPARIGNSVCGRFRVSLYSGVSEHMGDVLCHWVLKIWGSGAARSLKRLVPAARWDQSAGHVIRIMIAVRFIMTRLIGAHPAGVQRGVPRFLEKKAFRNLFKRPLRDELVFCCSADLPTPLGPRTFQRAKWFWGFWFMRSPGFVGLG